jgi:acyl dehydratase
MKGRTQKHHWGVYREQLPLIAATIRMCGRAGLRMVVGHRRSLNPDIIGKKYAGKLIPVTAEKIELFASATNDDNPLYYGKLPGRERVAPPMFFGHFAIHSLTKLFSDPHLHLDFSGMFHAGQDMEFLRPLRPGESVFTKSFVKKIVDKGKGEILVTNTLGFTEKDELVAKGYSSWYVRKPKKFWTPKVEEFREQLYWEPEDSQSVRLIDQAEVSPDQTVRYAKISGDYNPVHISNWFAKILGEGKRILQGMCTMSFVAKAVVNGVLKGEPHRLKRLNVRFLDNVTSGDTLETYCWPIDPSKTSWASFWMEGGGPQASLIGLKVKNQEGDVIVSRGVAKIEI